MTNGKKYSIIKKINLLTEVDILDNRFYDNVIAEIKPFFDEHGFVARADGSFQSDERAVKVEYNEDRQMYLLLLADISSGEVGEYSEVSAWLFDDSQNAKDAAAVGIDFTGTLREKMGIKLKRPAVTAVDLPSADKSGSITVSGFAKRVLDVFPQYKDAYRAHVAKYGNFLYLDFYADTLVIQIKSILTENSKKTVKKLFELLEYGYVHGDRETVNSIVAVVSAAVCEDEELTAAAYEMLESDKHFQSSVAAFIPVFAKKRKLREALLK